MSVVTKLAPLNLTTRQLVRFGTLHNSLILGFIRDGAETYVQTSRAIDSQEKSDIEASLAGLSNAPLPEEVEEQEFLGLSQLRNMRLAQVDAFVDANVTDIASARAVLKLCLKGVVFCLRIAARRFMS